MVYLADVVADALIERCQQRGVGVSNLMLQKLMYYAQSWHLARGNGPLFKEELEAWVHGPVVPSVFRRFKKFGWQNIPSQIESSRDDYLVRYLDSVLDAYGKYSPKQLERLSHSETPWCDARAGLAEDQPSSNVIHKEALRIFFARRLA